MSSNSQALDRIVFIGGSGRSGTTLLAELLGAQPGVFNAGEISGLWSSIAADETCSCGAPASQCGLWAPAVDKTRHQLGLTPEGVRHLGALSDRHFRLRHLVVQRRQGAAHVGASVGEQAQLSSALGLLLTTAMTTTNAHVLVDASKRSSWLEVHRRAFPGTPLTLLHMLRDPRGVVSSLRRSGSRRGATRNREHGPDQLVSAAAKWSMLNLLASRSAASADDYQRLTYESLIESPEGALRRTCGAIGVEFDPSTVSGQDVTLERDQHVLVGNIHRLDGRRRTLVKDDRYLTELSPREQHIVSALTWPARRYLRHVPHRTRSAGGPSTRSR